MKHFMRRSGALVNGFTYVELVLALMITAAVMAAGAAAMRAGWDRFERVQAAVQPENDLSVFKTLLARDLRCAYLSPEGSLALFCGRKDSQHPYDRLDFIRTSEADGLFEEVGYAAEVDPKNGRYEVRRRVQKNPDGDLLNGGKESVILPQIQDLRFQFFDGENWRDNWGWDPVRDEPRRHIRGLPVVVRLSIRWGDAEFPREWSAVFPVMISLLNGGTGV